MQREVADADSRLVARLWPRQAFAFVLLGAGAAVEFQLLANLARDGVSMDDRSKACEGDTEQPHRRIVHT